jgi:hypothetical protein
MEGKMIVTLEEATKLTGFQIQAVLGSYEESQKSGKNLNILDGFNPQLLASTSRSDLEKSIISEWKCQNSATKEESMFLYLSHAKKSRWYGTAVFQVLLQSSDFVLPNEFLVLVNVEGVHLLDLKTKEPFRTLSYSDLEAWFYTSQTVSITANIQGKLMISVLKTLQGIEICSIIEEYTIVLYRECKYARAVLQYVPAGEATNMLSFQKGDVIKVLEKNPKGWWTGEIDDYVGLVIVLLILFMVTLPSFLSIVFSCCCRILLQIRAMLPQLELGNVNIR